MSPNPLSHHELTIQAGENMEEVVIYNILGEVVFVEQLNNFSSQATLNIPDLTNGMYSVSILFEGNKQSIQKLMIGK